MWQRAVTIHRGLPVPKRERMGSNVRLIDADTLIKEFERYMLDPKELRDAIYTINYTPTVDAVPVIRCRECKWWSNEKSFPRGQECRRFIGFSYIWHSNADDFCSLAERREDG